MTARPLPPAAGSDGAAEPWDGHTRLHAKAQQLARGFVSPHFLAQVQEVARRRGHDWCTSVLTVTWSGLRGATSTHCHLLVLADEEDVDPPLPAHVERARVAAAQRAAALGEEHDRQSVADAARWAEAADRTQVAFEVRPNVRGRRTGTGLASGPLRHATPLTDAYSGTGGRHRAHAAGRALCETPGRARPLPLGSPTLEPVTCARCLLWAARVRPAP